MRTKFRNIIVYILLIVFATTLLFGGAGCKGDSPSSGGDIPNSGTENSINIWGTDEVKSFPDKYIMSGSKSSYKLVVPDTATEEELTAAGEFTYFVNQSTGCIFETVTESQTTYNSSAKYIYFGKTVAAANLGIKADSVKLKKTGYILKTVGDSIFIVGATSTGTLYGTYDLLNFLIEYECYAYDCLYVKEGIEEISLYDFDIEFIPTIETRLPYLDCIDRNVMVARRMKSITLNSSFVMFDSRWVHTCDKILPYDKYGADNPSWYSSDRTQWCFSEAYSNESMFNTLYSEVKAKLELSPTAKYVSISQNDVYSWCTCSRCSQMRDKYGSDLAVIIPVLNKVAKKIKVDFPDREVYVHTFSYHKTSAALTYMDETVMCEPNVTIMFAPIRANYTTGFTDETNSITLAALQALSKVCQNITAWTYDAHFPQFFICNETFSGRQERIDTMSKYNVEFLFNQSMQTTNQSFSILKAYLDSKLSWNNKLNMQQLIEDFCDKYYYTAADTILQYLDSYRTWAQYAYNKLGMHTDINGSNHLDAKFWPKGKLLEWQAMFDQAFQDIETLKWTDKETYELALKHVTIESLSVRYLLIQLYGSQYDPAELDAMKRQFKKDCYAYDIVQVSEAASIDVLFDGWGI